MLKTDLFRVYYSEIDELEKRISKLRKKFDKDERGQDKKFKKLKIKISVSLDIITNYDYDLSKLEISNTPEIMKIDQWIKDNCKGNVYNSFTADMGCNCGCDDCECDEDDDDGDWGEYSEIVYAFENKEDAALFKLTWS